MVQIDDIVTDIFKTLKPLGISVFKYRSPIDQKGTFVVINPLAFMGRIEQIAVINVNLYTDNLVNTTPNTIELNKHIGKIINALDGNWKENNQLLEYRQSGYIYEDKQTFINLQLNFRKLNYGE